MLIKAWARGIWCLIALSLKATGPRGVQLNPPNTECPYLTIFYPIPNNRQQSKLAYPCTSMHLLLGNSIYGMHVNLFKPACFFFFCFFFVFLFFFHTI